MFATSIHSRSTGSLMSVPCVSLSSPSSLTNALCALSRSWMGGDPGDIQLPWPSSRAQNWASCGCRRPRRDSCGCRLPRRCRASGGIGRACRPARSPWRGRCHRCRSRQPPPPERADRIREDYAEYFKAVVKACAIFRLAADPFPILRSDPQCEHRFPDCITPEFSQSFIGNCLGNDFVESITLRRIITAIG